MDRTKDLPSNNARETSAYPASDERTIKFLVCTAARVLEAEGVLQHLSSQVIERRLIKRAS
jgi:hypothetical protein